MSDGDAVGSSLPRILAHCNCDEAAPAPRHRAPTEFQGHITNPNGWLVLSAPECPQMLILSAFDCACTKFLYLRPRSHSSLGRERAARPEQSE
jgi:hypothetical protein